MQITQYEVQLINHKTGQLRYAFGEADFLDLRYEILLNDIGALALTLPYDPDVAATFALDDFVEVKRLDPNTGAREVEYTYLVRSVQRILDENNETLAIGALSLNHLIARRVIHPDDDPLSAGGYSTKAGAANDVLESLADEHLGAAASAVRRLPEFSITTTGSSSNVGGRWRYNPLLDVFQELCVPGKTNFQLVRSSGRSLVLQIGYIGVDRTIDANWPSSPSTVFSPLRGNLANASYTQDRQDEQNTIYAISDAGGNNATILELTSGGSGDSYYNRIEFSEQISRSEDDSLYLLTGAVKALADKQGKNELTFELSQDLPGATYHVDWELGDRVTVDWDEVRDNVRVIGVEINLSDGQETIQITTHRDDLV